MAFRIQSKYGKRVPACISACSVARLEMRREGRACCPSPRARVAWPSRFALPAFPARTDGVLPRLSAPAGTMFIRLNGIPEPPEGYVPPLGSSRETWTNIYKNKGRIDYCVQQFGVCSQRQETRGHTSNPDTSRMRNDTACGQHQHQHHPVNTLVCIMRARTNSLLARALSLSHHTQNHARNHCRCRKAVVLVPQALLEYHTKHTPRTT